MRPPRGETDHASAMPDEMLLRALSYLDLDSSVHASLVAPRWAGLFNETIAQAHCERIYLDQAHAKVLNPGRFHGSYKQMLRHRPRVRMTGFYVLKSSYIKRPVRDMWTELKPGTILEVRARGPSWVPGVVVAWGVWFVDRFAPRCAPGRRLVTNPNSTTITIESRRSTTIGTSASCPTDAWCVCASCQFSFAATQGLQPSPPSLSRTPTHSRPIRPTP